MWPETVRRYLTGFGIALLLTGSPASGSVNFVPVYAVPEKMDLTDYFVTVDEVEIRKSGHGAIFTEEVADAENQAAPPGKYKTRWLRAQMENKSGRQQVLLFAVMTDYEIHADFFVSTGAGGFKLYRAGMLDDLGGENRTPPYYYAPLDFGPGEKKTIYFRTDSYFAKRYQATLWAKPFLDNTLSAQFIISGLIVGSMAIMAFYNFFLYLVLRDASYLYYSAYAMSVSIVVFLVKATVIKYGLLTIWEYPVWLAFWGWTTQIFIYLFMRSFLGISREKTPVINALTLAVIAACFMALMDGVVNPDFARITSAFTLSLLFTSAFVLAIGLIQWRRGAEGASYFVAAWAVLSVTFVGKGVSALLGFPMNYAIFHLTGFGIVAENTLLSLALAYRIKVIREEKELAQLEIQRTLESSKNELEKKVEERTRELSDTNAELMTAKEAAENATMLKDKFVGLVSHDLRSPLGGIIGMADILGLSKEYSLDEVKKSDIVKRIHGTAKGLVALIDQLLNISRIKTGKLTPSKSYFAARGLVEMYISNLAAVAEGKGIRLVNEIPGGMRLFADPALYGEVVTNLLSNALKFTRQGDTVTVYAPEERPGTIAVRDTGSGIPAKIIGDLFKHEIKTSLTGVNGEKGTGLGLPYCHDIMLAHNGTITVDSREGEGSVFRITLPQVTHVIMIADDQEAQREMIKASLSNISGAAFIDAGNGDEAVNRLTEAVPDLIITDIEMPVMNGFSLLQTIRKNENWAGIPVIVATSAVVDGTPAYDELLAEVKAMGADDLTSKPVTTSGLYAKVCAIINR
ncbi:MAG: hybrid sensor histidine kinase/response regulator [Nitrospinae bacterium]|nr:hybrid sensor histidine kinase/response regulator [Nitrospinota bacterium]